MGALHSAGHCRRKRRSLQRLAQVELQLVLQFLDRNSRLKAARCSRQLFHAADDEFAWPASDLFVVCLPSPLLRPDPVIVHTSLLRHAPVLLSIASLRHLQHVCVMPAFPRLRALRTRNLTSAPLVRALLAHPALQQLESLHLETYPSPWADVLDLAARLPQLRSLSLWCADDDPDRLQPLLRMQALTDLTLLGGHIGTSAQHLIVIGQVESLRALRVPCMRVFPSFAHFPSATPMLQQLRHLALGDFNVLRDFSCAIFSRLPRLHSLHLIGVRGVDALLAELHCAPPLRLLTVECAPEPPDEADPSREPSAHPGHSALQALLARAPLLTVQLQMASMRFFPFQLSAATCVWSREAYSDGTVRRFAERQWAALRRMAADLHPRVTSLTIDR